MTDHYDSLGVARDASDDDIRKAFRKLARQFHPDISKAPDAEARMREINAAYECLKDGPRRLEYDATGRDRAGPNQEAEAHAELERLFDLAIESDTIANPVEFVLLQLATAQCNLSTNILTLNQRIAKLVKRRDRVRSKAGRNLVQDLIERKVRAAEQQVVMLRRAIETADLAKKLAANYEFVPEEQPPAPLIAGNAMYTSSTWRPYGWPG